ncbi:hypothetical protein A3842_05065 [Paenibacillus sp. P3E]|uniref:hypothetical protein n=1 Tax=Paenibacillus sp. P3E TaxID=1349435 RepID=UPI00093F59ED|nr:hypothetical protein [Paenibacillus sp. P3E]OKP88791.1 hypothetical protein A3842_05065 [Paenibacillus sp. P3E]
MTQQHSCFNCHHIIDDCEYGDYGSTLSIHWDCGKRGEELPEDADFPFDPAPKECFRLDFWHSEFCLELEDGSQEEMSRAYAKYEEWCKQEYAAVGPQASVATESA